MEEEIWLESEDYPKYDISNTGKIRNRKTGRIMKTSIQHNGYEQVSLRKDNKYYTKRVHRLVADAFYGHHDDLEVNHIDCNKLNNHIDNLEFCDRRANTLHAFAHGLRKPRGQIRVRVVETGEEFESIRACGRATGCDQSEICAYFRGEQKSVRGLHFEKI